MRDVRISADGFLFKAGRILPESFAFARLREDWTRGAFSCDSSSTTTS
jgi:hypothetical protein